MAVDPPVAEVRVASSSLRRPLCGSLSLSGEKVRIE